MKFATVTVPQVILSISQAAKALSVSRGTMYQYIAKGFFHVLELTGKRRGIAYEELLAFQNRLLAEAVERDNGLVSNRQG